MEYESKKSKYKSWPCYTVRAGIRWTHWAVVVNFKRAQTHGNKANSLDWKARFVCKKNAKRHVVSLGRGRCFCLHTCTDKLWNEDKAAYRIFTPIRITNAILYWKKDLAAVSKSFTCNKSQLRPLWTCETSEMYLIPLTNRTLKYGTR